PSPPAAHEADAAAEHRSLLDAAPEHSLDVAAEEVGGAAAWAEKSERQGDAPAPAPELDRGQRFFDRLKFFRSEPRRSEPQAREEGRMFEPPGGQEHMFEQQHEPPAHEPSPHEDFPEPMLESSYAVDDARPPAHDAHAATDAIDDEYVYEESEEDLA